MKMIIETKSDNIEKRNAEYDFIKGILIAMVILNHVINQYGFNVVNEYNDYFRPVIFAINMPAFFVMAGFFCKQSLRNRGIKNYCVNKIRRLAWPLLIWGIIRWITNVILENDEIHLFSMINNIRSIWFLPVMFCVSEMVGVLIWGLGNIKKSIIYVLFFETIMITASIMLGIIYNVLFYAVFYVLGVLWDHALEKRNRVTVERWILIFSIFVEIVWFFTMKDLSKFKIANNIALTLIFLSFLSWLYSALQKTRFAKMICKLGRNSLEIYVLQIIAVELVGFRLYHSICWIFFAGQNVLAPNEWWFYGVTMWLWMIFYSLICYGITSLAMKSRFTKFLWKI